MLNLTRQPRSDGLPGEELVLRFDQPEARGTLILRECAYGLEIVAPDLHPDPLAVLDLYYAAAAHLDARARSGDTEPDPLCQIIIHTPAQTEDALGRVRFFADHTEVDFDPGATEWQSGADAAGGVYGYPLADYPSVALACNPWGSALDPALVRRTVPLEVGFDPAVAALFQKPARDAIETSWKLVTEGQLPLPIGYTLLAEAADPTDLGFAPTYFPQLRAIDRPAAEGFRKLLEGMGIRVGGRP